MRITLLIVGLSILDIFAVLLYLYMDTLIEQAKSRPNPNGNDIPYFQPAYVIPDINAGALHSTVSQYFRNNQQACWYRIEYALVYHTQIEILREDGWMITLENSSCRKPVSCLSRRSGKGLIVSGRKTIIDWIFVIKINAV